MSDSSLLRIKVCDYGEQVCPYDTLIRIRNDQFGPVNEVCLAVRSKLTECPTRSLFENSVAPIDSPVICIQGLTLYIIIVLRSKRKQRKRESKATPLP